MFAASHLACFFCDRAAKRISHTPVLEGDESCLLIKDLPIMTCDELACRRKSQNLNEQISKEMSKRGDLVAASRTMYHCSQCTKAGTSEEMFKCSRCKACLYCSKACQTAHWRAGHKKECDPM